MPELDLEKWAHEAETCADILRVLVADAATETKAILDRMDADLAHHRDCSAISLSFVGQYSAGKSTIISALTGRRDIYIDADIATDRCTPYTWNSMRLIDTPGLWTEHEAHDAITMDEIKRSDLLAFCLTVHLFDPITLRNFRDLAVTNGYAHKMLLVVNKLFTEAGNVEKRLAAYRESLDRMTGGQLRAVPLVFVDAKLYLEGIDRRIDRGSDTFVAKSRFSDLIGALNTLSAEQGVLAKADTPFRIVLAATNEALFALSGGDEADQATLHLVSRCLEIVRSCRKELKRDVKESANDAVRAIIEEQDELMLAINGGNQQQFAQIEHLTHERLRQRLAAIGDGLRGAILSIGARLQREVGELAKLPLFEHLVARVSANVTVGSVGSTLLAPRTQQQVGMVQNLVWGLGGVLTAGSMKPATIPGAEHTAQAAATIGGFDAMGGDATSHAVAAATPHLDQAIRSTVEHLNANLHLHVSAEGPLHAAHKLGHFLDNLGPLLALGAAGMTLWQMHQEHRAAEALGTIRTQLQQNFETARQQARANFEAHALTLDADIFLPIENDILAKRDDAERTIGADNELVSKLRDLRGRIEGNIRTLSAS